MPELLQLCFEWPTLVAFGLITIIALWDIVYGEKRFITLYYPRHPKVQIASYIFCAAIFVLWQISPEWALRDADILSLLERAVCYIAWYIIAKLLIYAIIYALFYCVLWRIIGKLP